MNDKKYLIIPRPVFPTGPTAETLNVCGQRIKGSDGDNRKVVTAGCLLVYGYRITHHARPTVAFFVPVDRDSTAGLRLSTLSRWF